MNYYSCFPEEDTMAQRGDTIGGNHLTHQRQKQPRREACSLPLQRLLPDCLSKPVLVFTPAPLYPATRKPNNQSRNL